MAHRNTTNSDLLAELENLRAAHRNLQEVNDDLLATNRSLLAQNRELSRRWEDAWLSERKLATAHGRLKTLMDTLPIAVTIAEDPECRVIMTNPAGARMFGVPPEQNISASAPPRERPGNRYFSGGRELQPDELPMQVAVSQNRFVENFELETHLADGRRWVGMISASPIHDQDGAVAGGVAVAQDITGLKRAEEALRENETRLRLAQESAHVGIWDWMIETGDVNFTPELNKLYGIPPGTIMTYRDWRDRVHPDDIDRVEAARDAAIGAHEPFDLEFRGRHTSGEYRWISTKGGAIYSDEGKALRVFGVNIDITERKRSEEALRQSEALYRGIGESIDYGVWVCAPDGRNLYASASFLKMVGITQEQCSDFGWGDVLHPDDAERTIAAWQECVRTGGKWDIEHRFKGVDGLWHHVLARGVPVKNEHGEVTCWAGINLDINHLKQAEETLRNSEERYRLLAETMMQGVVHQDARGTIIFMNPAAERILGKSRNQFIGSSSDTEERDCISEGGELFPGTEHPSMVALRTGQPVRCVVMGVFNPQRAEYRWINIYAMPLFRPGEDHPSEVYTVFQDVTELKQAEMALLASEQRIQQALQVSRSFTFEWVPDTDQVTRSASCSTILNLTGDDAVNDTGTRYFQRIHPDDRTRFLKVLHGISPDAGSYTTEYRVVCGDGSEVVLEELGQGIFAPDGRLQRVVGVTTDITTRMQAETALKKLNEELENRVAERTAELRKKDQILSIQNRQAAMGEMIGNIAHQWRQPLNNLALYTQRLGYFYDTPDFDRNFLETTIAKSMSIIQHMSKTIDDFRNYFKPEKEKSDFGVRETDRTTLSIVEGSFQNPNITVEIVENATPVIYGYQNEFAQALLNILVNARDAIVERQIVGARVVITIGSEQGGTVVTVADNAGGIPEEIIDKVFDPYFSTKGPQQGTGIGLFMSKTIIEKNMGGRLTVRNTAEGAEFRIEV
jgi:PAS domain S-box-containing protein